MIKTKTLLINISGGNIKHYKKLGYDVVVNKKIEIPIEHLPKSSHEYIEVYCDICGSLNKVKYQNYQNSIKFDGKFYCMKNKCAYKKLKLSNNKKYNVENVFQLDSVKEQIIITNNEKYDCDNPQQNKEIKERTEQTCIKKYGFRNPFQNEDIKKKCRETNLKNLGVEYPTQSPIVIDKIIQSNLSNHGVQWGMQNRKILDKAIKTSFKISNYKSLTYQGSYELDFLKYMENKGILDKLSQNITIRYTIEGIEHVYHPDYYIKDLNLICEIKSSYIYHLHYKLNQFKQKAAFDNGYDFIMIIDKNYDELEKLLTIQ